MRIVYIYDTIARWGGIERVLADKVNWLIQKENWQVYLLTTDQGTHKFPFKIDNRVFHEDLNICFHSQYRYSRLRRIYERIRLARLFRKRLEECVNRIHPDVIISGSAKFVNVINEVRGSIPYIVESHSGYEHVIEHVHENFYWRLQKRRSYRQISKATIVVSLSKADALRWSKNVQTIMIPNIVHLNPTGRYSSCDSQRVIYVGRLARQKGIPDLLAIWKLVHERHPRWQLDIYGEGDNKDQLLREIERMDANIYVHDPVVDIFSQYIDSSIFLLTSIYEPFGLVLPEAMSCGLPVVSFEADGPNSIITDGKDGIIVREREVEVFANRVCQLIEDKELRRQMGKNAIISAQRYSAEHIMPMWINLFESLKT